MVGHDMHMCKTILRPYFGDFVFVNTFDIGIIHEFGIIEG